MTIEYDKSNNGVTIFKTPKVKIVNGKRRKFYGSIDYLIKPEFQTGDNVFVKWSNTQTYKAIIKEKLRKNWGVEITDDKWYRGNNLASVPAHAITKRCH